MSSLYIDSVAFNFISATLICEFNTFNSVSKPLNSVLLISAKTYPFLTESPNEKYVFEIIPPTKLTK